MSSHMAEKPWLPPAAQPRAFAMAQKREVTASAMQGESEMPMHSDWREKWRSLPVGSRVVRQHKALPSGE